MYNSLTKFVMNQTGISNPFFMHEHECMYVCLRFKLNCLYSAKVDQIDYHVVITPPVASDVSRDKNTSRVITQG